MSQAAELFDDSGSEATETAASEAAGSEATTPAPGGGSANKAVDPDGYEAPWLREFEDGKFKTAAEWMATVAKGKWKELPDMAKSYSESSKQAREFKTAAEKAEERWKAVEPIIGAPVDAEGKPAPYEFKLPEEVTIVPELMEAFQNDLREMNLGPAVGQKVLDRYIAVEAGMETARREMERDFVVQQLGGGEESVAVAAVNETLAWVRSILGDSPEIEDLLTTPGATSSYGKPLALLHHLRAAMTGAKLGSGTGTNAFGKEAYEALVKKAVSGSLTADESKQIAAYLRSTHPDQSA